MNLGTGWKAPKINGLRTYQYCTIYSDKGRVQAPGRVSARKIIAERHGLDKDAASKTMLAEI